MTGYRPTPPETGWRKRLYTIIFEADTRAGRRFDQLLLIAIVASLLTVMLESVASIRASHGTLLFVLDWAFTLLFTAEYVVRLLCVPRPLRYARSLFGIIDLLSILPLYIGLVVPEGRFLTDIRILRLLRIFRVLNMPRYLDEARELRSAMLASRRKIMVFLFSVVLMVILLGTLMYVVEGEENGFTSIPVSIYWAVVTLTTVGFGDITPKTPLGQMLASVVMILGYGIIAVPTGIVTAEIARSTRVVGQRSATRLCPHCFTEGHDLDARYCKFCSGPLPDPVADEERTEEKPS